jgi:mono/diheme cytochrome c family protein
MEGHMKQMKVTWPRFEDNQMNDLLAYIREERGGPQREFELLPADPRHGWELFRDKACIACHAIKGEGGTTAPDLGAGKPLPPTLTQMAAQMWTHSPQMWAAMAAKHIQRPTFEGQEMADLLAFLYSLRSYDLAGSALVGKQLFTERGCGHCHGAEGQGGEVGPALRGRGGVLTPVTLARILWSHGPRMYNRAHELGLSWPALKESDLGHLLAFLNSPPEETR